MFGLLGIIVVGFGTDYWGPFFIAGAVAMPPMGMRRQFEKERCSSKKKKSSHIENVDNINFRPRLWFSNVHHELGMLQLKRII